MRKRLELDKETLHRLFIDERLSAPKIAKLYNCSQNTILNHLKYNEISIDERYINKKYGKLTVISKDEPDKHGHNRWNCVCECGRNVRVLGYQLDSGNTKTCGCSRTTINSKHPNFKGYKEIGGKLWYTFQKGARDRNLPFEITIEYAWELFEKQNRQCSLTGLPLKFSDSISKYADRTASLDRIDSMLGYVEGNVQWVHVDVNFMKQNFSEDYFIKLCQLIVDRNKLKNE